MHSYSSTDVMCIGDYYISFGNDVISIKSGWDEYGITYGHPSSNITVWKVTRQTHYIFALALGSKMSGDIKCVHAQDLLIFNSRRSVRMKIAPGRDDYVKDVYISNVIMKNESVCIIFIVFYGEHPDHIYDPNVLPYLQNITFENILGDEIKIAGFVEGIQNFPSKNIFLSNIEFIVSSEPF